MSDGRYNIPKQYKVDKGMPLEVLFQRIDNLKCRRIFESGIESVEWSYHLVDKEGIANRTELVKERGVSLFEVKLRRKISPDLLTEVFAGLLQRPMVLASSTRSSSCPPGMTKRTAPTIPAEFPFTAWGATVSPWIIRPSTSNTWGRKQGKEGC